MPNLRLIYDNAVDRATSITASTQVAGFPVSNVQNDYKGKVHRSTGTSVTYTIQWDTAEPEVIGGIVLPATNLQAQATIRVRCYSAIQGGGTLMYDSTTVYACPGSLLEDWDWNLPINANAFAFGGLSKTAIWVNTTPGDTASQVACKSIIIDLVDTTNPIGYIDCARIISGAYWEPTYNVKRDTLNLTITDTSTTSRNNSGDLLSDRGIIHDHLTFDFSLLDNADKENLTRLLRNVGARKNIVVSVFPEENSVREQDYIIYGKRSNSAIGQMFDKFYSHSVEMIGW